MDEIEIMALSTVLNCTEPIFLSVKVWLSPFKVEMGEITGAND